MEDNNSFRFDSEYFKKKYLDIDCKLLNFNLIETSKLAKISDGDHSKFPDNQLEEIRYLQAKDIKNYFVDDSQNTFVSRQYFDKQKRSHIFEENILMSIMGNVGDIAITPIGFEPCMANRAIAIIKNIKGINPYFMFTFLITDIANLQIERLKNGGVQERINLEVLSNLKIPILLDSFQSHIEIIIKNSYIKLEKSKTLYKEAEELLLNELDLVDFKPCKENIATKSFKESFGVSGRLDSEYYQPKYDQIIEKIKNYQNGFIKLKDITKKHTGGYAFSSNDYLENGDLSLIRINNIKNGYLDLSNAVFLPNEYTNLSKKDIVKENDILISMSGSIGLSCKVEKDIHAMVNQRILKIEIVNFKNDVLVLILNSIISSMQLERIGTGGVQTNISSNDILNILIPSIDETIQILIEEKIKKSFELKEESKKFLDLAKRAVDVAIEENEDKAIKIIEEVSI